MDNCFTALCSCRHVFLAHRPPRLRRPPLRILSRTWTAGAAKPEGILPEYVPFKRLYRAYLSL